ncbi:hypothetical protein SMC26_22485 [Actinomadura fulvescens]|uniref:Mce-associated membrane protein n=1 Tax=Actinomadura fulvescens TaxID=46160 RepID=A0ABP6BRA1_9ACTN
MPTIIEDPLAEELAPARPAFPWVRFAVAAVVAVVAVVLLFLRGSGGEESPNRALTDADATTKAVGDVSNTLTRVFTYSAQDTATAERAAAESLSGRAATEYRRLFAEVKRQAPADGLALKTRVVRAGLVSLTGDKAQLLVFLDQVTTRSGKPAGTTAAAQLSVTAELKDGLWRITDLKSR